MLLTAMYSRLKQMRHLVGQDLTAQQWCMHLSCQDGLLQQCVSRSAEDNTSAATVGSECRCQTNLESEPTRSRDSST